MLGTCKIIVVTLTLGVATGGCVQITPKDALRLNSESLEQRQLQTRYFDTPEEIRLLTAVTAVLQDLGFTHDDSASGLGLVVASKKRDASEFWQIGMAIIVAAFTGAWIPTDDEQLMRASVVTRPIGDTGERTAVRVTFQRIVWNTEGQVTHAESLTKPAFYQEFFAKLSKAVFLQAHAL